MALLNKKDILDHVDLASEVIDVPEWGGQVKVITMSGFARDRFEASITGKNGGSNFDNIRAKLAAATIADDAGNLLFDEADIAKLGRKSCAALDRVFAASQKLNRLSQQDVEDLAKN